MIEYCLSVNIITEQDIKYALYSSLTVQNDYYNPFIQYLYNTLDDHSKMSVNSLIGCFKPKEREHWKSLMITDQANVAFYHYLDKKGCFIDCREIKDKNYYQVFNKFMSEKQDTEAPLYNQIIDLEAIEVHKLMTIIKEKGGTVLDVSTDCVSAVFPTDELPFELVDDINIKGYYFDETEKFPRYKLEDKTERLKIERMPNHIRTDTYMHKRVEFKIYPDVADNDFTPLVSQILDSNQSWHIDGRAGCGKSTLVNMLQKELRTRGMNYGSLAPTNKACRIINGTTIHRFVASNTGKTIRELNLSYLFIDEVSMMSEMFYKYFVVFRKLRPDIKFIIAGDFAQLLPVKERIDNPDYKNSIALHELCDGQRLQLSKCRRSDDTLFNMLMPENINNLTQADFNKKYTKRHISFTNAKRITTNNFMMEQEVKCAVRKGKKPLKLNKLEYDPNSQDVQLVSGMPIIARKNSKELNIANNETFVISEIRHTKKVIIIEEDGRTMEIKFDDFQHMFYVAFCITIHKSQGCSFDHEYTIHEFNRFDERLKYVALSRATKKEYINIFN
jgi:hypothetical protein